MRRQRAAPSADPAVDALNDIRENIEDIFPRLETMEATLNTHAKAIKSGRQGDGVYGGVKYENSGIEYSGARLVGFFDDETREFARLLERGAGGANIKGRFKDPEFGAASAQFLYRSMLWQRSKGADRESATICDKLARGFDSETAAALTTTTTDLGGHWLPDPVANELYRLITDNSILSPLCSHIPMTTKTLDLPVEGSSSLTVTWGGSTTNAENANIVDSVPSSNAVNKITITANRINGFAAASLEEVQDSPISILGWIQQKLTELSGRELDRVLLEGVVGTVPNFVGLGTHSGVAAITAGTNGDTLTYLMLVAQMFKAKERASRRNARWFCSPELASKIIGLSDNTGQPVVQFGAVPSQFAQSILGYPLEITSSILSNRTQGASGAVCSHLYFGPPSAIVIGDRVGMAWDVSDAPGFQAYQLAMRLVTRVGMGIAVPAAWSRHENYLTT